MGSSTQVYFNERKVVLKLQFILGVFKNRLGSSIAYYQAQQQNFLGPLRGLGINAQGFALTKIGQNGQFCLSLNKNR